MATIARAAAGNGSAATKSNHQLGDKGLELIKSSEGCRLSAYQDSVGVWTIGYGHTHGVHSGQKITQSQADGFLRSDCQSFVNSMNTMIKVAVTQNQFDALVSLAYNLGAYGFKDLLATLNKGHYKEAQGMFKNYCHAGGKVLQGLVTRRAKEAALFGSDAPNGVKDNSDDKDDKGGKGDHKKPEKHHGGGSSTYTVKSGDTLWHIATSHHMSLSELLGMDGNEHFRKNPDLIYPGQKVHIKGGGGGGGGGGHHKKDDDHGKGGGGKDDDKGGKGDGKGSSNLREKILDIARKSQTVNTGFKRYSQAGALTEDPTPKSPARTDCSQWARACYKQAGGPDPGTWTGDMNNRGKKTTKPKPADLMLTSGHVEMYVGDGKTIGHGSPPIDGCTTSYFASHWFVTYPELDKD